MIEPGIHTLTILEATVLSVVIIIIGHLIAWIYGRKTEQFSWLEYFLILLPLGLSVAIFYLTVNAKIIYLVFYSAIFGTIFEHIIGVVYHKVLNKPLWSYNRLTWKGYTSMLSIPLWGFGGLVFWVISQFIGL